jgi:arginase
MAASVPGHRALPERAVILAGARDFDPAEEARLRASSILHLSPDRLREGPALATALGAVDPQPTGVYLHVDLDVLDAARATDNVYAAPGGVDGDELHTAVAAVLRECPVRAVSLTAYDPSFDVDGRVPPIALRALRAVAEALRDRRL